MRLRRCQHPQHMRLAAPTIGDAAPVKFDFADIGVNLPIARARDYSPFLLVRRPGVKPVDVVNETG